MVQSSQTVQSVSINRRRKLWTQLLVFLALAALLYVKPKVEAWLESRQNGSPSVVEESSSGAATPADGDAVAEAEWKSPFSKKRSEASNRTDDTRIAGVEVEAKSSVEGNVDPDSDERLTDTATAKESAAVKKSKSSKVAKADGEPSQVSEKTGPPPTADSRATKKKTIPPKQPSSDDADVDKPTKNKSSSVVKMDRQPSQRRTVPSDPEKSNPPPSEKNESSQPPLGKLREVSSNVFESTAGLIYEPGSADGHRLRHVMEHAKDNLQKPVHGVFDGDRDEILATIDEAYLKAKKGGADVRSERQNNRQIYTVNLKRRIGQMGGSEGERKGNPECRYLRMVLENGNEIVSAYPTRSF